MIQKFEQFVNETYVPKKNPRARFSDIWDAIENYDYRRVDADSDLMDMVKHFIDGGEFGKKEFLDLMANVRFACDSKDLDKNGVIAAHKVIVFFFKEYGDELLDWNVYDEAKGCAHDLVMRAKELGVRLERYEEKDIENSEVSEIWDAVENYNPANPRAELDMKALIDRMIKNGQFGKDQFKSFLANVKFIAQSSDTDDYKMIGAYKATKYIVRIASENDIFVEDYNDLDELNDCMYNIEAKLKELGLLK